MREDAVVERRVARCGSRGGALAFTRSRNAIRSTPRRCVTYLLRSIAVRDAFARPGIARLTVGLGLVLAAVPAYAQLPPQGSPLPRIMPREAPAVGGGALAPRAASPATVPNVTVAVRSVSVTGATVFPQSRVARLVSGLAGQKVPLADIEKARVAVLDLYRRNGFPFVTVSAALDHAGNLRITVIEAHVTAVKLSGNIGPAGTQVLRFLNHLTEIGPLSSAALERWLLLAQEVPGVSVHAILRPSALDPGALTLVADVSRKPFSALLTADNAAFPGAGPVEGLLVLDANSFTEFGEKTEVSLYHTSGNTQNYGQAAFETFVGGSGLRIRLYYGQGPTNPSGDLRAIGYQGLTTEFGVAAIYPLLLARNQTLNLETNFDAIDSEVRDDSGPEGQRVRVGRDEIRAFRLGADYARQDLVFGAAHPAIDTASARLSFGLPFLGSGNDNPEPDRIGEQTGFTKITGELTRTQTLFSPWNGASVALLGLLAGQWSPNVLPPVEKFYLGGLQFTRGFYSGEVTGDSGVAATAELQLNTTLAFTAFGHPVSIGAQFYGFYDWGYAWQNQPSDPNARLASAGGGVRLTLANNAELDLVGLRRFTRTPLGSTASVKPLAADAFYWRFLLRY